MSQCSFYYNFLKHLQNYFMSAFTAKVLYLYVIFIQSCYCCNFCMKMYNLLYTYIYLICTDEIICKINKNVSVILLLTFKINHWKNFKIKNVASGGISKKSRLYLKKWENSTEKKNILGARLDAVSVPMFLVGIYRDQRINR